MPLPLILVGAAALIAGYGVKKGFDAKSDFNEAEETNEEAQEVFDEAFSKLELTREKTEKSLEGLGELKFKLYKEKLIPFVAAFKKIHNIDFQHDAIDDAFQLDVDQADMLSVEEVALKMTEVVGGGITALGAGGLAGLATYGSVGFLASASTGTAIAGLSGAAATNATLAWLGGGALSAGGMGMAVGSAVLGGIVLAPAFAVGGMMLASKAEAAKHNAYSNLSEAEVMAEQMETANIAAQGVHKRIKEIHRVLVKLDNRFEPLLEGLQSLVAHSPKNWSGKIDYMKLNKEDQVGIMVSMMMAKTIKNVLETQILDEQGLIREASGDIIDSANHSLLLAQKQLA
jgi:hypothetical protein